MSRRFEWRRRVAFAALAVGALLTAGCATEAPLASPSPSVTATSPSPTPTPSSSLSRPVVPEAATANTPAGAEAFIRYYFEVLNKAFMTPKSGLLPPLSDPGCQFCAATEKDVTELASLGQRYATAPLTIGKLEREEAPEGQEIFITQMMQSAATLVDSRGETVRTESAQKLPVRAAVSWNGKAWQVFEVESQQ